MILAAAKHAWATAFCPHCEKLVNYQLEDVRKVVGTSEVGSVMDLITPRSYFKITCRCGKDIVVGERVGP